MFRDRTEAMLDRRGPGPGPGPVLMCDILEMVLRYEESYYHWLIGVADELSIGTKIIILGGQFLGVVQKVGRVSDL